MKPIVPNMASSKDLPAALAEALPNAMRLGFTGTPISLRGADTVQVFGDLIHTYDIYQSQKDHATVPIYYEPRQIRIEPG